MARAGDARDVRLRGLEERLGLAREENDELRQKLAGSKVLLRTSISDTRMDSRFSGRRIRVHRRGLVAE